MKTITHPLTKGAITTQGCNRFRNGKWENAQLCSPSAPKQHCQTEKNEQNNQNLTQVEVSEAEPSQSRGNWHEGHCIAVATCSNV